MDKIETEEQLTAFNLLEDSKYIDDNEQFIKKDSSYKKQSDIPLDVFSSGNDIGPFKNPVDESVFKTIIATEDPFHPFSTNVTSSSNCNIKSFYESSIGLGHQFENNKEKIHQNIENINKILTKTNNNKKLKQDSSEDGKLVVKSYLRDPNLPKRPITPYLRFAVDERKRIINENPDVTFKESATIAAKRWRDMDLEGKNKYRQKYQEEKAEYDRKIEKYKGSKARKDFVMLKGAIKGDQYNIVEQVTKPKRWAIKKAVKINLKYDPGMDNDVDFWTVYHEISSFNEKNVLVDLIRVFNKYKTGVVEEQKEVYNKEIEKIQELGDYFKSFVNFVKRNVLNNKTGK